MMKSYKLTKPSKITKSIHISQTIKFIQLFQFALFYQVDQLTEFKGHSCKIGNMRCPGTLKNQNPQFEEKK